MREEERKRLDRGDKSLTMIKVKMNQATRYRPMALAIISVPASAVAPAFA